MTVSAKNIVDRVYRKGSKASKAEVQAMMDKMNPNGEITSDQAEQIVNYFLSGESSIQTVNQSGHIENLEPRISENPEPVSESMIPYQPVNSGLSLQQSTNIVFEQVQALDLDLKTSEIKSISQELHDQRLEGDDAVLYAMQLLKDYVTRDEESYINTMSRAVNDVVEHVNGSYQRRNQLANDAVAHLATEVSKSRSHYKSSAERIKSDLQEYFANT